jgi:hypothetical protein
MKHTQRALLHELKSVVQKKRTMRSVDTWVGPLHMLPCSCCPPRHPHFHTHLVS